MIDPVLEAPGVEDRRRFWNRWDAAHREGRSLDGGTLDPASVARARITLQWIAALGLPRSCRILEVGCANGWLSEKLAEFGVVTAVDLADEVLVRARGRLPHIAFIAGDFLALPLPLGSFDVVVCLETIFAIPDQAQFLGRIADLLRPEGHLLLTTQNRYVFERMEGVEPQQPGQIRRWLSWRQLRRLLQPRFLIRRKTTLLPEGCLGLLRLVNSYKLDALSSAILSPQRVARLKEWLGFGQTIVVLARRVS